MGSVVKLMNVESIVFEFYESSFIVVDIAVIWS